MFRAATLVGGLVLGAASFLYAQQPSTPPVPEDVLAPRELIAWSNLQTPRPAQQALPTNQTPAYQANQDPSRRPAQEINSEGQREPAHATQLGAVDSRTRTR